MEIGKDLNYLKTPESLKEHIPSQVSSKELKVCLQEIREWV